MIEKFTECEVLGFLPHEAEIVLNAIKTAIDSSRRANIEYGETVSKSGGDWAFDDPASQAAALEAHMQEKNLKYYLKLGELIKIIGLIPYPDSSVVTVTYGSRVFIKEDDGYESVYDLATRRIPEVCDNEDIMTVSPDAPIARSLLDSSIGEHIEWTAPSGKLFNAIITNIDQEAVKKQYNKES